MDGLRAHKQRIAADVADPARCNTHNMRPGRRKGSIMRCVTRSVAEVVIIVASDAEQLSKARSDEMCELTIQQLNNPPDTTINASRRHRANELYWLVVAVIELGAVGGAHGDDDFLVNSLFCPDGQRCDRETAGADDEACSHRSQKGANVH